MKKGDTWKTRWGRALLYATDRAEIVPIQGVFDPTLNGTWSWSDGLDEHANMPKRQDLFGQGHHAEGWGNPTVRILTAIVSIA
jgi:hypothetical protein